MMKMDAIIPCLRRRAWMIALLILGFLAGSFQAAAGPFGPLKDKQILMLTSYGAGRPGVEAVREGFVSALNQGGISTDQVFIEHLDLERAPGPDYVRNLAATLRLKYGRRPFDAIYVVEQPALDFLLRDLAGFAPGAPVVAVRANLPARVEGLEHRFVSQHLSYDVAGTLEQAMALFPNTRRVLFISGSSASDKALAAEAAAALGPWRGRVFSEDTSALSLEEIQARIAIPSADSIILVLPLNRDAAGRTAVQMEVAFMVAASAQAPVFTLWEPVVGRGAVGGSVTRFLGIGQQAGQFVLGLSTGRIGLAGAVTPIPTRAVPMYDWKQVERWAGDAHKLPEATVFINRTVTLWAQHRRTVILALLVLSAQAILILVLLMQRRRRMRAEAEGRRVQRELETSEKRFRDISEAAGEFLWETDPKGRLTYISGRITEVLGYQPEELIGRRPDAFVLPAQAESFKSYLAADFRNLEAPLVTKAGQVVWISVTRIRMFDDQGALTGSRGAGLEITGRKLAEAAQRESEARYRSYVDFAPDGVFIADETGRYVEVNPAACRMTGFSREELLASGIADLLHPDDQAGGLASFGELAQTGRTAVDLRYRRKDGTFRWWHVAAVRLSPTRYLGFAKDIDENRNAAEQVRHMNEELERQVQERTASLEATSREMESFSYSVSHDLRAPLRGIDGFSHVLLEDYGDRLDAEGRRYLGRIRQGIKHMGELIDDLLKLSRIIRCDLERESVDLSALAGRILDGFAQRNPERAVQVHIAPGLKATGDPRLVTIALENLLGNAWKYTLKTPEARVEFGLMAKDGEAVYFVRDNGAGFDMRYVDKLFTAFQRLHSPQEYEGSGIGLAIVQRVVQRHGGRIWAQAEPDLGAAFFFTLPA